MIVFKDKDISYVAIPMGIHEYSNKGFIDHECEDNWLAFYTDDKEPTIIVGDVDNGRTFDIIRYSGICNNLKMTRDDLHKLKDKMKMVFEGTNVNVKKPNCNLYVMRENRIFEVNYIGSVMEVADFDTVCESRQYGYAIYENVKHIENIEERVKTYYKHFGKAKAMETFPIVLLSTKNKMPVFITK